MKTRNLSWIVGLFLACTAVSAEERRPVGAATQQWLDIQKSGDQASEQTRPLKGDVARRSHERYLRSFEYEIPASFSQAQASR